MTDERITWYRGELQPGVPRQTIGVDELRADGRCRAVFAERAEVDGRCHVRLARTAWGPNDERETRWWSLELGTDQKVYTVRNGSCGDALNAEDVPRVVRALEELGLADARVMLAVDDGPAVMPWRTRQNEVSQAEAGRGNVRARRRAARSRQIRVVIIDHCRFRDQGGKRAAARRLPAGQALASGDGVGRWKSLS
jgi:hypothetical protein